MLVPVEMVQKCADGSDITDAECAGISDDMCSSLVADAGPVNWLTAGTKADETCTGPVGITCNLINPNTADANCTGGPTCELGGNCEAEYARLSDIKVGCGTNGEGASTARLQRTSRVMGEGSTANDVAACTDILQTHMHEESCPAGCYFSPKYKFEEAWRVSDLLIRAAMGIFAAMACGFMQDPAQPCDGKCKVCSVIEIIVFVFAFLGYLVSLWVVLGIEDTCKDHGHTEGEMSAAAKEHYGGESHWCQQFTGVSGTLVFIVVFLKACCSLGCVVGGSMAACCMPPEKQDSG